MDLEMFGDSRLSTQMSQILGRKFSINNWGAGRGRSWRSISSIATTNHEWRLLLLSCALNPGSASKFMRARTTWRVQCRPALAGNVGRNVSNRWSDAHYSANAPTLVLGTGGT